jgi:hypothetical protein
MAGGKSQAPQTAAEGMGNILRAITDTMQAPDAVQFAGPLMHLQTTVLDMIHGHGAKGGQQGPGGPPGAAPPGGGGPPGAGAAGPPPGGGGAGLAGGLSGMMGAPQGPSNATSGGGPSLSGMDPEQMRQMALTGAGGES